MNNSILAGRWRLDDQGVTTVEDSSGNNNNGQFVILAPPAGVTWTGNEPAWAASNDDDDTGVCLNVNNGSAVVTRPPVPAGTWILEPQQITVEACFRAYTSPGAYAYLVSKGALGGQAGSYALYTSSTGTLSFYVMLGGVAQHSANVDDPDKLWDGKWHVAAGTFDGTLVRLFLDGEEVGAAGQPPPGQQIDYDLPDHNDFYIGAYNPDGFAGFSGGFVGEIAEVRIWKKAILM